MQPIKWGGGGPIFLQHILKLSLLFHLMTQFSYTIQVTWLSQTELVVHRRITYMTVFYWDWIHTCTLAFTISSVTYFYFIQPSFKTDQDIVMVKHWGKFQEAWAKIVASSVFYGTLAIQVTWPIYKLVPCTPNWPPRTKIWLQKKSKGDIFLPASMDSHDPPSFDYLLTCQWIQMKCNQSLLKHTTLSVHKCSRICYFKYMF